MKELNEVNWRSIFGRVRILGSETYRVWKLQRLLGGKSLKTRSRYHLLNWELSGDYLISTEQGIFRAHRNRLEHIFPLCTFGISVDHNVLYAAVTEGRWSFVVRAVLTEGADKQIELSEFRLLYKGETYYHNERIHQLHARNGRVAIANTRNNSITVIDGTDGELLVDIYPLNDASGFPIKSDHSHINSVYQSGDILFFVAHNGGNIGSLIGYIHGDRVRASCFPNRGVHDIIPADKGLIFSDTFGSSQMDHRGGGNLIYEGRTLLTHQSGQLGYMIRGVAGKDDELLVGHSHHGKRKDRFKGSGGLLIFKKEKLVAFETMPFSQVYDIIRLDGGKLNCERNALSASEAERLLISAVGPISYESQYYVMRSDRSDFEKADGWFGNGKKNSGSCLS